MQNDIHWTHVATRLGASRALVEYAASINGKTGWRTFRQFWENCQWPGLLLEAIDLGIAVPPSGFAEAILPAEEDFRRRMAVARVEHWEMAEAAYADAIRAAMPRLRISANIRHCVLEVNAGSIPNERGDFDYDPAYGVVMFFSCQ